MKLYQEWAWLWSEVTPRETYRDEADDLLRKTRLVFSNSKVAGLLILATKKEVYIAKTLKKFESHFRMHKFIRIHKSYLVNQENIPSVDTSNFTQITTLLGNYLPVSRRKLAYVRQKLS